MLLAIDIGNTHTVVGIFDKKELMAHWRLSSTLTRTEDEFWLIVKLLCDQIKFPAEKLDGVVISSVVPNLTDIFERLAEKYIKVKPVVVSSDVEIGIKIKYDDPKAVGADRICNAVAAYKKYRGPAIVIDFGTATTFDIISKRGDYLGGVISPGIETAGGELHRRAARLPKIELHFPKNIIGKNTVESMQSGIMFGALDAMEGMIKRIKKITGEKTKVISTGGYSKMICKQSKLVNGCEPWLVLEGARLIFEMNKKKVEFK
ncbi:MAG: type III pantothenate kinase [Bacteroidetes bacterium]|nr:type III pantothenate kinase [Bacteroidota bacterium]MBU1423951.1 type III pantothenate kinase [Bacteroidota bacterium]MBU2637300.1 type III pantothenate kinase [Bacteroidota bacterium]